jgi:hypothetical protein
MSATHDFAPFCRQQHPSSTLSFSFVVTHPNNAVPSKMMRFAPAVAFIRTSTPLSIRHGSAKTIFRVMSAAAPSLKVS